MRSVCLSLAYVLGWAAVCSAQGVPPPADDPKVEALLNAWEKAMGAVKTLEATVIRTRLDKTFGSKEVFEGKAKFLRSSTPGHPSRASLHLELKGRPEVFEKYINTGAILYEFRPASKLIVAHELPAPKSGAVADDNIIGFIFGMKASEVKKRYFITYGEPPPGDKWYNYLNIQPRFDSDKGEFSVARLVVLQATYLPAQFWFRQPNGDETTWDLRNVKSGVDIPATEFGAPAVPPGWRMERQKETSPRVLRD